MAGPPNPHYRYEGEARFGNEGGEMKGKVLIVDDDPKMGKLLKFRLSKEGFETEYFSSGKEALEKISQVKPHIIISDIEMPEMNGHEFCDRLRQDPGTASIPFIFLSAKTDTSDQLEGLRLGADDYVCKPLKMDFLLERMEKVLERAARARSYKSQADFSGNLSQMNLNDVIQIVESNHKSGELVFSTAEGKIIGRVLFNKGNLVNATLEKLSGAEAFFGLMDEEEGLFEFFGRPVNEPEEITITNMAALLQGSRLIDESKSLYRILPNLDVLLKVNSDEISDKVKDRAGEERINKLFSLIDKHLTARQIINSGDMSRPRSASILADLIGSEIVTIEKEKSGKEQKAGEDSKSALNIEDWLVNVLKSIAERKLTGILEISGRKHKQAVYFNGGEIVHAYHGKVVSEKALYRIFAEAKGSPKFKVQPVVINNTINKPMDTLLEEGNRETALLADLRKATHTNPITVNIKNIGRLSRVESRQGIKDVFALVQQHGNVQEVIDASPLTDLRTYNHLLTMVKLGVIAIDKKKRE